MTALRSTLSAFAIGIALACSSIPIQPAMAESAQPPLIDPALSPAEVQAIGREAIYWGLNAAGFYELRYLMTQAEGKAAYRGLNRILATRQLNKAGERIATTPNPSSLTAGGFFDVSKEPMVVISPGMERSRYWSIQAADQYANWFFMVGSQFTGNRPQRHLIVGPHWRGTLPADFSGTEIVRATSDSFTITLRIVPTLRDDQDFAEIYRFMDGIRMVPLSLWQQSGGIPPPLAEQPIRRADYPTFPRMAQIGDIAKSANAMDYFQLLGLVLNDPTMTLRADSVKEVETLRKLERIGLRKGVLFDPGRLTGSQKSALERGFVEARRIAHDAMNRSLVDMNGWKLQSSLFFDPNDYEAQAGADDIAWGTPVPYQSHTIAYVMLDADGRELDGKHRYTVTFDINELPPVTEYWDFPVYDELGYLVPNPIERYSVISYLYQAGAYAVRAGKLTFYLQNVRPDQEDEARNWLPIPASGPFQLAARFYGPLAPLIDGTYPMPRLVRVN